MKYLLTVLFISFVITSFSQTICGTANENGTVTLTAPAGNIITSIDFASYGTPNGSCGSFTIGACHATNSQAICESVFLGQNSASIGATNGVFGDPCSGTVKRLYIQATYASNLPLNLLSFSAKGFTNGTVQLEWKTSSEINTLLFVVEKSTDGFHFDSCGKVASRGYGDASYRFTDQGISPSPFSYYRLKMVDKDLSFRYSKVSLVKTGTPERDLKVFPTLTSGNLIVSSNRNQDAIIFNSTGQEIQKLVLINGSLSLDIASWKAGVYFIKTAQTVEKFIKQ